jgi:lipoprotein NlpD
MRRAISSPRFLVVLVLLLPLVAGGCAIFGGGDGGERWYPRYEVEAGDTLYSIAWAHGLDYRELAAWNGIGPPYQIHPGDTLRLTAPRGFVYYPPDDRASRRSTASATPAPAKPSTSRTPESTPARPPANAPVFTREPDEPSQAAAPAAAAPVPGPVVVPEAEGAGPDQVVEDLKWRWPTQGELLRRYAPADGSSGLDIGGNSGQQVRAAANGKVVYGGSGLQGYGLLVIVKHDDNYLSAYGFNRKLLVQQGDEVHIGQPIAEMGEGPQQKPLLHFEVRRAGKTIDPLEILPTRP